MASRRMANVLGVAAVAVSALGTAIMVVAGTLTVVAAVAAVSVLMAGVLVALSLLTRPPARCPTCGKRLDIRVRWEGRLCPSCGQRIEPST